MRSHQSYVDMGMKGAVARWSKEPPFEKRFWSRVDIRGEDECWPWKKSRHKFGYGKAKRNGKHVSSHRIAFELTYGAITPGLNVLHSCDNPPCCNPKHLYQGTHHDNNMDACRRSRWPKKHKLTERWYAWVARMGEKRRGSSHNRGFMGVPYTAQAPIKDETVDEIRRLAGTCTQAELSKRFHIDQSTISRIIRRQRRFSKR